jgi:hypothetical protein
MVGRIVWEPGYSKEATRGQRELLISNAFFFLYFLSELFERKTHSAHVPGTWIFKGGNEWATSTFDFECVFFRKGKPNGACRTLPCTGPASLCVLSVLGDDSVGRGTEYQNANEAEAPNTRQAGITPGGTSC